ncbi:Endonuclease/Exonuclease/phosphatase family protein [compost metagenome]
MATYSQTQKTALFYKKELFDVISSNHILTSSNFNYNFAGRPPLEIVLKTKVPAAPDTIYAIVIHLKAYAEQESYDRRKEAATILKTNYLDLYRKNKKTIVLGDWNDDLDQSTFNGMETPFKIFLDNPNDYFFPTKALSDAGKTSYAFYSGSFLDHIMVTSPLKVNYIPESANVLDMMPAYISNFSQNTSDHYPVISSFRLHNMHALGIQSQNLNPHLFGVAADGETVFALGEWEGMVEIYSISGTKVGQFEKQTGSLEIPVHHLPHGMYIASLQLKDGLKTYKFVH